MIKVAVTGNIASGKSTVCEIIADLGFPFVSCDHLAHQVLELPKVIQALSQYDVVDSSGQISRSKLGKLVFGNPKIKTQLENITHPLIFAEVDKFSETNKNEDLVFVEVPLLFEVSAEARFDVIILVYTNDDIRLVRLMQRNKLTKDAALARIKAQQSQDDKVSKSTHVIYNNDNPSDLVTQIRVILEKYNKGA
ncbi:MAG: dephospho-CoA kinase [Candidatus Saccharimonadales bacterium]